MLVRADHEQRSMLFIIISTSNPFIPIVSSPVACDVERPCQRCRRIGKEDSCQDAERKKRGRPPLAKSDSQLKAHVPKNATDNSKHSSSIKETSIKSSTHPQYPEKWFMSWQLPSTNKFAGTDQIRPEATYRVVQSEYEPNFDNFTIKHDHQTTANYSQTSNRRSRSLEIYDHHPTFQQPRNPYHQVDPQGTYTMPDASFRVKGSHRPGYNVERWLGHHEGQSQLPLYYSQPTSPWTPTFPLERNSPHHRT
jgi:hypothetical protein